MIYADVRSIFTTPLHSTGQLPPLSWSGKAGCVMLIAAGVFVAAGATVEAVGEALKAAHNHHNT